MAVLEEEVVVVVAGTMIPLTLKGGRSVITATLLTRFRSWNRKHSLTLQSLCFCQSCISLRISAVASRGHVTCV
jgi:hypothetical protein